jgi:predicted metal-dependent phosphoesterase TrpH
MLIDMHIHTRFSPCSVIRIRSLLSRAREVGIDGVCITDHDTMASKHEFEKLSDIQGICFIIGMEYTTTKGDFLVYGPLENIPLHMGVHSLLKWAETKGAVVIPAHPFRKSRPVHTPILKTFDIIECLNGRNHDFENEACFKWIREHGNGKRSIGGSDAHTLDEIGRIVTVFEKNIYGVEDLIRELRHGKYAPLQRNTS